MLLSCMHTCLHCDLPTPVLLKWGHFFPLSSWAWPRDLHWPMGHSRVLKAWASEPAVCGVQWPGEHAWASLPEAGKGVGSSSPGWGLRPRSQASPGDAAPAGPAQTRSNANSQNCEKMELLKPWVLVPFHTAVGKCYWSTRASLPGMLITSKAKLVAQLGLHCLASIYKLWGSSEK